MSTQITLPLNTSHTQYQWGVMDTRTQRIVRPALTRQTARNKARLSKHYVVVRRTVDVGHWSMNLSSNARRRKQRAAPKYM